MKKNDKRKPVDKGAKKTVEKQQKRTKSSK